MCYVVPIKTAGNEGCGLLRVTGTTKGKQEIWLFFYNLDELTLQCSIEDIQKQACFKVEVGGTVVGVADHSFLLTLTNLY